MIDPSALTGNGRCPFNNPPSSSGYTCQCDLCIACREKRNRVWPFLAKLRSGAFKHYLFAIHNKPTIFEDLRPRFSDDAYPWVVICVSILLNRTTMPAIRKVVEPLFEKYPDTASMADATGPEIVEILGRIHFAPRKASSLIMASRDLLHDVHFSQIQGLRESGTDAYWMFARGIMPVEKPHSSVLSRLWVAYRQFIDKS